MNALLITATDTEAGKTVLTTALAAYLRTYCAHQTWGILKPIQTGKGDCELYSQLFALAPDAVTPLRFDAPLAPPLAAAKEGRRVDMEPVWQAFETMRQQYDGLLVEALGGLGSPITHETTVADLAWDWRLPTVLVVPVKLGAIGQAVANVALARQTRVHLKGIVLNCVQPCTEEDIENWASADLIQSLTRTPVLGVMPHLTDPTDLAQLAQVASNLALERLIPVPLGAMRV
ncbi:ATP-dependent dethiobiotin synthetase BioD [Stenomitos frigidus ULC18]|uniref:ATP-dependent dethiobiotin synthetase BioD n=1 Tax=Stenomitos frigidus ULC18 TaxID=2107698 RepID=A0A2T1EBF7_9CYAN|nr:dethiobiotin synthase [Stenomitos frigidus]PSB30044.1 ATP-dependent dethiobiotin synthetase BioD [Stenomitos frigidus ULC18]